MKITFINCNISFFYLWVFFPFLYMFFSFLYNQTIKEKKLNFLIFFSLILNNFKIISYFTLFFFIFFHFLFSYFLSQIKQEPKCVPNMLIDFLGFHSQNHIMADYFFFFLLLVTP